MPVSAAVTTGQIKQLQLLKRERQRTYRLRVKVKKLETSLATAKHNLSVREVIQGVKRYLDEPMLSFFASQLRNATHSRLKGRRWTNTEKGMALSLYHQGPQAYRFYWLINLAPGFPENVLQMLEKRVGIMHAREKLCVVSFDEVSLQSCLTYNASMDSVEGFEDFGCLG